MFPLESVLFPSTLLPLHVFEPRYRELMRQVLAREGEFGVTLIARGSEVGGGDSRFDIGTRARLVQATELPDGRWAVLAAGVHRISVVRWLADDPFPRAEVDDLTEPECGPEVEALLAATARLLRRALALRAELGEPAAPATIELAAEPTTAAFQMGALAPVGPADAQHVLEAASTEDRLRVLARLLEEQVELLEAQVSGA
jgi:Lon protease-like protein